MGIKLVHLKEDSEFYELARVERTAFENPDNRLLELYFPLLGPASDEAVREASILEAAKRQISWHHSDPTSTWIKVVDEETGDLLGASLWHVYDTDPYSPDSDDDEHGCVWFPEGEDRNMADALMDQFYVPRLEYMKRPHVFLDILFTAPTARRRGVGKLMMDWGTSQADKRGLVSYIDATAMGKELYATCGFVADSRRAFELPDLPHTPRLQGLAAQLLPFEWWPMYRPMNGELEGVELPWVTSVVPILSATSAGTTRPLDAVEVLVAEVKDD